MLSSKSVQLTTRVLRRGFATAAAKSSPKPLSRPPPPPPPKSSPPSKLDLTAKPKSEPEPFFSDDFAADSIPVSFPSTPVSPISKPPQPFAKKPAPPPPSKVLTSASSPSSSPSSPTSSAAASAPPPPPSTATTPLPPTANSKKPAAKPGSPNAPAHPKSPSRAKNPAASSLAAPTPAQSAAAQGKELARQLQGRTPAQLLNQIAQLQQHNATLQSQLVYHSAVEAIYGESGFNQLRNLISEFTEEESNILKASGFESENVIHHLETKQRELCLQFTQAMGADLAKHIGTYVKKLKDQHRQSASAATATQQTLRNAGVPDTVISSTLVGLQPHLDELQTRIVRWEKLKADVDLLLATHSGNH